MNTNFEGILPVGFPVDAPYDERYHGLGALPLRVSVPGANRRWVRVNLPADTPVIEATTGDTTHSGMPCKYLAVPTYYKGLISWSATQFTPGVPNSLHLVAADYPGGPATYVATYLVKARITGLTSNPISASPAIYATASARLTTSEMLTYDSDGEPASLRILPTLCSDGVVCWMSGYTNVYQQVSFEELQEAYLPIAFPASPVDVIVCHVASRALRADDGLAKYGMLFSLNTPLSRFNTATVRLAPALFSNALTKLAEDTEGVYDNLTRVVEDLPIAVQAESGAAAPATAPGSGTDVSGIVQKLGSMDLSLTALTSIGAIRATLDLQLPRISEAILRQATIVGNHLGYIESEISRTARQVSSPY